jgi:hypothetical protein
LLTFFLATQKESELPPGNPRPTGISKPERLEGRRGFDKLSPNGGIPGLDPGSGMTHP